MTDAVIVAAARSPIGKAFKGSLVNLRADDMAGAMITAALAQVPQLDPTSLDDIILGCAQPAGEQGYGMARMVAIELGLDQIPGTVVQRYCASSLQGIRMATHAVRSGEASAIVVAGAEAVSRFSRGKADGMPDTHHSMFAEAERRSERRSGAGTSIWTDPREVGAVPDAYLAMGQTAENVAQLKHVSRQQQDEFAASSQQRAAKARDDGFFARDITPLTLPDGTVIDTDDCPRSGVTVESLGSLSPVFRPDGTVTVGNCCPLNDGAAAVIVMSAERARSLGITPLARVVSTAVSALSPEIMGLGTIESSLKALQLAGLEPRDLDLIEINEAFAAQVVPTIADLQLDPERVNVHGGAIALGHPYGQTGARMATTLINGLQWRGGRYGLETMCAAGGQGMAMVIERLS